MKKTYQIKGMTCDRCKRHVENTFKQIDGVVDAQVDLQNAEATVTLDREIDLPVFAQAFEDEGGIYQVSETS